MLTQPAVAAATTARTTAAAHSAVASHVPAAGGRASLAAFAPQELENIREIALMGDRELQEEDSRRRSAGYADDSVRGQSLACVGLLVSSLCPTIYGHELVKLGLLLSLFGGTRVGAGEGGGSSSSSGSVRPDIHCLVVGDPGLGKVLYGIPSDRTYTLS